MRRSRGANLRLSIRDDRAVTYSWAFFSAKQLGTGQFYLMTINDKDGDPFDGAATYRLTVPANVPVTLCWSLTAYDRATHTLIGICSGRQPILEHPWPAGEIPTARLKLFFDNKTWKLPDITGARTNRLPRSRASKVGATKV